MKSKKTIQIEKATKEIRRIKRALLYSGMDSKVLINRLNYWKDRV